MKNKLAFILIATFSLLTACKKSVMENVQESLPAGAVLKTGNFVSNSHPTSGTVKIIIGAGNKKFLTFENFQSDNGPDLRVWLSPNNTATTYQEIGTLKGISGNFYYELTDAINYSTNNRVLIWCEDFSVLFGHAILL